MNTYRYRAARADGTIARGCVEAPDTQLASTLLAERGLVPLSLRERAVGGRMRRVGKRELAVVFRSVASLCSAGVPVDRALAASEAVASDRLAKVLRSAQDRLRQGDTLAQSLRDAGDAVPGSVIGVVAAGERGSQLNGALDEVANQLEADAELTARVRSALAYPALILAVGVASLVVMSYVVIPRFAVLLADLGAELPATTRALLWTSGTMSRFGWLALIGVVAGVATFSTWSRTPAGRLRLHTELLRMPVAGSIRLGLTSARVCRSLAATLNSGMPLLAALDAGTLAVDDDAVALRIVRAREHVARGEPLTSSLEREEVVVRSALQLLAVGESSGTLALMARRAADLASRETEHALARAVTLLEPGLVVALGGLVAFVAAALLQAVYSLRPGVAL